MKKNLRRWITLLVFVLPFSVTLAGENVIRFKILKLNRDASQQRFMKITRDRFNSEDIAAIEYEEEDTGYGITDEMWINHYFGFFVTAGYYGQYRTDILLTDGSAYTIDENLLFGYGGVAFRKRFAKRFTVFGLLGYGYWRDRIRANDLSQAELDPPLETLYHTSNEEGFSAAYEVGLSFAINDLVGITVSYEKTDIFDVDMTAWSGSLSFTY